MADRLSSDILIRTARLDDIPSCKLIVDQYKKELGFVSRGQLIKAVEREDLLVADLLGSIVASCERYRRQDGIVSIYLLAVHSTHCRHGVGSAMLCCIESQAELEGAYRIQLKCPLDLEANEFYAASGYDRDGIVDNGRRQLISWSKKVMA